MTLLAIDDPVELRIRLYPWGFADTLGDAPDAHRWRARWDDSCGAMIGIALQAYPVVRLTPCGAWIDPYAYAEDMLQPWKDGAPGTEWVTHDVGLRWVSNDGGAAWAKPTQEDAVRSLALG